MRSDFMEHIKNYYLITDQIATSGQPTSEQFSKIAQAGYQVIINLALPSSDNAIADEGAIVTRLGMIYIHIPVIWDDPKIEDLQFFCEVMESLQKRKVWVHCALNMRVSCFMYLYRKLFLQLPETQAKYPMTELWQPNPVWQKFIHDAEMSLV